MWQTFPEHTKNLTAASQEGHCKSLNGLARNRIQGPGSQACRWLQSSPSRTCAWVPKPQHREQLDIWQLLRPAERQAEVRGVGSGFQTHRRSGLQLHTVCVSREPVAQPRGQVRPWTRPDVSHPGLGCSKSRAGAQTQTRWEKQGRRQPHPIAQVTAERQGQPGCVPSRSKPGSLRCCFPKGSDARSAGSAGHFKKPVSLSFPWGRNPDVYRPLWASSSVFASSPLSRCYHFQSDLPFSSKNSEHMGGHVLPGVSSHLSLLIPRAAQAERQPEVETAPPQPPRT